MAMTASASSLYEVLGISMSASGHEIKAAYRRLARMCHPDVVAMNQKEMSATEFMKIHAAYSTLSDPNKRANYDRDLFRRRQPIGFSSALSSAAMASMSRFSGGYKYNSKGNWETDQCW
ncbi:chaperone protein dnaJ 11, chloroplastic-like [Pistacia vera]|uniref:chaperone protein dnaJ 11, chloroplastic-like n=1 Tax=Pistacia vera TaxID=55513 RepID=UPI00126361BE|nr:chaperone protein dnaJ 11, chloroplastic-like [Pistacia vera]XP_031272595.1 chaperone protein dnaJ 11, chloroplastic-like [Pistacia vera]